MSDERDSFAREYNVSRETLDRFDRYAFLLGEAAARFNLVAASTLPRVWERHFADSAQLLSFGENSLSWLDMGSGAGFPGIVLALFGKNVDLVETTGKKIAFLHMLVDELGLRTRVKLHHGRIETLAAWVAPVITARAFAPLARLFSLGLRYASPDSVWVLPKGQRLEHELQNARLSFTFDVELKPSRTSSEGRIVIARSVTRKARSAALYR